jgi:YD repeat-containing protein
VDIPRRHEQFGYAYDAAGNLQSRTNNALVQAFTVNNLNELTNVTRTGTLTVAGTATEEARPKL